MEHGTQLCQVDSMAKTIEETLVKYVVPLSELKTAEYCFQVGVDFSSSPKTDPGTTEAKQIITGLLNTCGGILSRTTSSPASESAVSEWKTQFMVQLKPFLTDLMQRKYIKLVNEGSPVHTVHTLVKKSPKFITLDYGIHTRNGATTVRVEDTDIAWEIFNNESMDLTPQHTPVAWLYDAYFKFGENENVEFKYWDVTNAKDLTKRLFRDPRLQKCINAMPNLLSGGTIYFGIEENKEEKVYTVKGQRLEEDEEAMFTSVLTDLINTHAYKYKEHGEVVFLQEGIEWNVHYNEVQNGPHQRRVVIQLELRHTHGGVFCKHPESYIVQADGKITQVNFQTWKKKISVSGKHPLTTKPKLPYRHVAEPLCADEVRVRTSKYDLETIKELSWSKNKESWTKHLNRIYTDNAVSKYQALHTIMNSGKRVAFFPDETTLLASHHNRKLMQKCVDLVKESHRECKCLAIASTLFWKIFDPNNTTPPHQVQRGQHVMDILSVDETCQASFIACSEEANVDDLLIYSRDMARRCKKRLTGYGLSSEGFRIQSYICTPTNYKTVTFLDEECAKFFQTSAKEWSKIEKALGSLIMQHKNQLNIKNRLGNENLVHLTYDQMAALLGVDLSRFNFIEGPPGSGKSILAINICMIFGKENSMILCVNPGLQKFYASQDVCDARVIEDENKLLDLLENNGVIGKKCVIIDDCHNVCCARNTWKLLIYDILKQSTAHLYLLVDNNIQNFQHPENVKFIKKCFDKELAYHRETYSTKSLRVIHRNSQKITSFLSACFPEEQISCANNESGDDIEILQMSNLLSEMNELPLLIKRLTTFDVSGKSPSYDVKDIVILVDGKDSEKRHASYVELFEKVMPDIVVHKCVSFPVQGLTIDFLDNFSGLEAMVVILVVPDIAPRMPDSERQKRTIADPRYKSFVASRGIMRVIFVTESVFDDHIVRCMTLDKLPDGAMKKAWKENSDCKATNPVNLIAEDNSHYYENSTQEDSTKKGHPRYKQTRPGKISKEKNQKNCIEKNSLEETIYENQFDENSVESKNAHETASGDSPKIERNSLEEAVYENHFDPAESINDHKTASGDSPQLENNSLEEAIYENQFDANSAERTHDHKTAFDESPKSADTSADHGAVSEDIFQVTNGAKPQKVWKARRKIPKLTKRH